MIVNGLVFALDPRVSSGGTISTGIVRQRGYVGVKEQFDAHWEWLSLNLFLLDSK